MFVEEIKKIFEENNFFCLFMVIQTEKRVFFSIKNILHACGYDATNKNIIHQTISNIKKKDIVNILDIKKKYMEKEIIYSEDIIDFETNNIFISDENLFYFLITLKKGLEFKRFFF